MLALPVLLGSRDDETSSKFEADLARARLRALVRQLPLVYLVLSINSLAVAYAFYGLAPQWLTLGAPAAMVAMWAVRAFSWRQRRSRTFNDDQAKSALRAAEIIAALMGLAATVWMAGLYSYGDSLLRSQLIFTATVSIMCAIFSVATAPRAALALAGITFPGFVILMAWSGDTFGALVILGLIVVAIALAFVVTSSSANFAAMIFAQNQAERLADENRRLANTDSLTGLPNRREFFHQLDEAIAEEGENGAIFMGVIDLDGFKPVNDLYGHAVGDHVLRECAARISHFANFNTTIARLGGDEFGIFVRGVTTDREILVYGAQICAALKTPLRFADVNAGIAASIGFARYPQDALDPRQLYERADYALYYGKQNNRGEASIFSPDHETKMRMNSRVEQALRKCDIANEITVEFQPFFNVEDESIVAFEALARWNSPELGSVSPDVFIPVAERSDIIHALTRTVLRKALREAVNWPADIGLSFNLSIRDLLSPRAMVQIVAIIASSGVDTSRIDIEVTETALATNYDRVTESIRTLKRLGVKISLDDFGTGYSSLAYVHLLPLDKIKIDRSFVHEMNVNAVARDIIRSMIGMCGDLRLSCVIEGVETAEQYRLLKSYGCDVVQGFLFGRPIASDDVETFIAEGARKLECANAKRA